MDIEKLIERLKAKDFERDYDCTPFECGAFGLLDDAATALSTLRAENSWLRAELEYEREHANAYYEECGQWEAENEKLRAEAEQASRERDAAVKDLNEFLSLDELCPIQCKWCKWENTNCDGKIPEWRGPEKED